MLQDPPEWALQATAPTDWTLLQQAKALRMGGTPPPMHAHVANSHKTYQLATTALGMQPLPTTKKCTRFVLLMLAVMVVLVAVTTTTAVCFDIMQIQPKTTTVGPTFVKKVPSPPRTGFKKVTPPPRTMRRKKKPTIKTAVNMDRNVKTVAEVKQHRGGIHYVQEQIHNTTVVMDKSKVSLTLKPWMELLTGTTTAPVKKQPKRQLLNKRVERFIIECDKFRWKGQRFLI
jgi:hypothetical protein